MKIEFEIAKKMSKYVKGSSGLTLRSLHMNAAAGEASVLLMAENYDSVKEQLASFPLRRKGSGKTLTVFEAEAAGSSCGEQLFAFTSLLPFNTEEALDVCEFLALPDKPFTLLSADVAGTSFSAMAEAEIPGAEGDEIPPDPEPFYDTISELIAKYNMGIIK